MKKSFFLVLLTWTLHAYAVKPCPCSLKKIKACGIIHGKKIGQNSKGFLVDTSGDKYPDVYIEYPNFMTPEFKDSTVELIGFDGRFFEKGKTIFYQAYAVKSTDYYKGTVTNSWYENDMAYGRIANLYLDISGSGIPSQKSHSVTLETFENGTKLSIVRGRKFDMYYY